jgi:hypothetical protein
MDTDAAKQITTLRSRLFSVALGAAQLLASQLYGAETAVKSGSFKEPAIDSGRAAFEKPAM